MSKIIIKEANIKDTTKINDYRLRNTTIIEQLTLDSNPGYAAILVYGRYILFTDLNWKGKFIAAIYEFSTDKNDMDDPIRLKETAKEVFDDSGHAAEWCFNKIK